MRYPIKTTMLAALLAAVFAISLSGCAQLFRQPPPAGASLAEVTAALGQPAAAYPEPDGGLLSYEQVLTSENFGKVKVDHWTKDDILRHFGRPAEISSVHYHNYEVWSYRYKEAGVWNSMMSVHFDQQGVVRQMLNGPDPMYDDRFRHR
jgi:hypothetical protein